MEVHLSPELEAELSQVRATLDSRYDDIKSGRVKSVDGEEFFEYIRRKSQEGRAARS